MEKEMVYRTLPVDVDSFEDIIENSCYYIDKTLLIKELIDMKEEVNFFIVPPRSGKTLNMDMLHLFFELPLTEADAEKQARLFSGLAISKAEEQYIEQMGSYPVIFLNFKAKRQSTWGLAHSALCEAIRKEFSRYSDVLLSDRLQPEEKERYLLILQKEKELADYQTALQFLSICLKKVYGRKTVILIDEYDVPLKNAYLHGFYNEMIEFLRPFFESALKFNDALEFAVMAGCMSMVEEDSAAGLNNLKSSADGNSLYAEYFGFTQTEVEEILAFYGCEKSGREVRQWHSGSLSGTAKAYNPWSVVNYIDQKLQDSEAVNSLTDRTSAEKLLLHDRNASIPKN